MKENNKECIYYLEQNKNITNLIFNNEVNSLEFVQKIVDMELIHLIDYKKRDLFLKKHGKILFRKFKYIKPRKPRKINIEIRHETRILSKEDIDSLLTAVAVDENKIKLLLQDIKTKIKMFYWRCSEWKIVISNNNIYYKFSLNGIERFDLKKTYYFDVDDILADSVLSQEEINMLLRPIDEEKK
ncbi:hypothetical protein R84B8_00044 [Treponema sp. R8-4-B8]